MVMADAVLGAEEDAVVLRPLLPQPLRLQWRAMLEIQG
jgi:hypothetical protein